VVKLTTFPSAPVSASPKKEGVSPKTIERHGSFAAQLDRLCQGGMDGARQSHPGRPLCKCTKSSTLRIEDTDRIPLSQRGEEGSQMWTWVETNKEWVFSGAGLTAGALLIWAGRSFWGRLTAPRPRVQVQMAMMAFPGGGYADGIAINFVNPTECDVVIGDFLLELTSGENLYVVQDSFTGARQQKRTVKAGDQHTFCVGASELAESGRRISDFRCAVVKTPAGLCFRSSSRELHNAILQLARS
jgi:hypothetical protein